VDSVVSVCLLVDTVAHDAGTERQVRETASRLDRTKIDVHLCCLEESRQLRELDSVCRTAVFPVESVYSPAALRQMVRFRQYLHQHHISVVHAFMNKTAIFGVLATRGGACRAMITSRLNTGYWYSPLSVRLFRCLNRHTTRIFANSEGAKRIAAETEGIPPEKIDVIYNGVDMDRYAKEAGNPAIAEAIGVPIEATVVGIVANLRPVKNLPLFLQAARLVAYRIPNTAFLIVGQGPLRQQLAQMTEDLGLSGRVFFTEGRGSVTDYLSRMSVGCISSKSEGFSNAILEYMAAGLPVVATDVGGNPEAIEDGITGYLIREHTPEAFSAPIIDLLRDPGRRATMGRRSLERCQRKFSIEVYLRNLERYYSGLASQAAIL
jgi:glycosyltransferase involved in cell wall biosynthesis